MYDAIYQAMTKEFAGVKGRKAVIVLTDGFVVGRTVTPRVFDDTIVEGDAVIYPMMFITRQHVGPGNNSIPTRPFTNCLLPQPSIRSLLRRVAGC